MAHPLDETSPRDDASDERSDAAVSERDEKTEVRRGAKVTMGNPSWFVTVMVGLMLAGLAWVVTFYVSDQRYPIEKIGRWNLGVGFGLVLAGFVMTTRWR